MYRIFKHIVIFNYKNFRGITQSLFHCEIFTHITFNQFKRAYQNTEISMSKGRKSDRIFQISSDNIVFQCIQVISRAYQISGEIYVQHSRLDTQNWNFLVFSRKTKFISMKKNWHTHNYFSVKIFWLNSISQIRLCSNWKSLIK